MIGKIGGMIAMAAMCGLIGTVSVIIAFALFDTGDLSKKMILIFIFIFSLGGFIVVFDCFISSWREP